MDYPKSEAEPGGQGATIPTVQEMLWAKKESALLDVQIRPTVFIQKVLLQNNFTISLLFYAEKTFR